MITDNNWVYHHIHVVCPGKSKLLIWLVLVSMSLSNFREISEWAKKNCNVAGAINKHDEIGIIHINTIH